MNETIRVGVVGTGALGQHHARVYANTPGARFVGAFDQLPGRGQEVAERHGGRGFDSLEALLGECDAVSVAVPTIDHLAVARAAFAAGCDVLVEKPLAASLAEADALIAAGEAAGRILQVGHIERFNPAADLLFRGGAPRFIEVHRLAPFTPRSLDIDVVLDLMIHDLDIVLALDGSEAVQVDAVGVPVLTPKVDIANARLRFASGLIANLTASRVSAEKVRKFRVFLPRTYVSADFVGKEAVIYRLNEKDGQPDIEVERGTAANEEPLARQLAAFVRSVATRTAPVVSGHDGRRALALAETILERIRG